MPLTEGPLLVPFSGTDETQEVDDKCVMEGVWNFLKAHRVFSHLSLL